MAVRELAGVAEGEEEGGGIPSPCDVCARCMATGGGAAAWAEFGDGTAARRDGREDERAM